MDALDTLQQLRAFGPNLGINWEFVLSSQYLSALGPMPAAIDVGAHQGVHADQMAYIADRVICFEPIPHLAACLLKHSGSRVVVGAALGRTAGVQDFYVNRRSLPESGLRRRLDAASDTFEVIQVPVNRLDDFGFEGVGFIKIDCEGGEMDIILGGEALIARDRPVIACEFGSNGFAAYGWSKLDLYGWAVRLGYQVCDLFGNTFDTPEIYDACVGCYYWDYLLIPEERADLAARFREGGQRVLADLPRFAFAQPALTA